MNQKEKELEQEDWLILSDLSMGGFVIFMILAVVFIQKVFLIELTVEKGVYDSLKVFNKENGSVKSREDGSVYFVEEKENPMFLKGRAEIDSSFQLELDKFIPEYLDTIASHLDELQEIRIEGHTDASCLSVDDEQDCYLLNLALSQKRAHAVLSYVLSSSAFQYRDQQERQRLRKLFVAVGYSYARLVDENGLLVEQLEKADANKSRRVEFRVFLNKDGKEE